MNLDFIDFTFLDVLDIILVAVLLHYIYKLLKGTVAINIVIGIALIFLIWKITQALTYGDVKWYFRIPYCLEVLLL